MGQDIYPLYSPSPEGYIQATISWDETYILCTVQAPKAMYVVHISPGQKTCMQEEITCELPQSRHEKITREKQNTLCKKCMQCKDGIDGVIKMKGHSQNQQS